MKILRILCAFSLISGYTYGQNLPACDSLVIDCCSFNPPGSDSLMITVTNFSSVLFDYPSFVLLDMNMDTIAVETVNYFGIGSNPQTHYMNLVAPLVLPFSGYLNLNTLFNSSLACTFPIIIPDTTTGLADDIPDNTLQLYPNPLAVSGKLNFDTGKIQEGMYSVSIISVTGQLIKTNPPVNKHNLTSPDTHELIPGIYVLQVRSEENFYSGRFIVTSGL